MSYANNGCEVSLSALTTPLQSPHPLRGGPCGTPLETYMFRRRKQRCGSALPSWKEERMFTGGNTSISSPLQKRRGTACGGGDGINTGSVLLPNTHPCHAKRM